MGDFFNFSYFFKRKRWKILDFVPKSFPLLQFDFWGLVSNDFLPGVLSGINNFYHRIQTSLILRSFSQA